MPPASQYWPWAGVTQPGATTSSFSASTGDFFSTSPSGAGGLAPSRLVSGKVSSSLVVGMRTVLLMPTPSTTPVTVTGPMLNRPVMLFRPATSSA